MILIDYVFWGWYQILDKTIYSMKTKNDGIGPKEHSFFISFLLHGLNVWTGLSYWFFGYMGVSIGLYSGLLIALGVFAVGYIIFFLNKRADTVLASHMDVFKGSISFVLTIAYTVGTVWLMFEVDDYIRYKRLPDLPRL
ncbi:hypothetical protein GCM10028791_00910 [Echinicola sediminis]